jgi:hypothetical protein
MKIARMRNMLVFIVGQHKTSRQLIRNRVLSHKIFPFSAHLVVTGIDNIRIFYHKTMDQDKAPFVRQRFVKCIKN